MPDAMPKCLQSTAVHPSPVLSILTGMTVTIYYYHYYYC